MSELNRSLPILEADMEALEKWWNETLPNPDWRDCVAPTIQGVLAGRAVVQIYILRPYRVHFNAEKPLAKIVKRVYDADGKWISKFALDASGEWREILEGEPLPPECIFELARTGYAIGQPPPVALATGGKSVV